MHTTALNLDSLVFAASRSFALTLRFLPAAVRPAITLAYALARISDSVADAADAPLAQRRQLLAQWADALGLGTTSPAVRQAAAEHMQGFAPLCAHAADQRLVAAAPVCMGAWAQSPPAQQRLTAQVLLTITQGQLWDVAALEGASPAALTDADIDHYTWQVAGCVGEFWSHTCELHLPHWRAAPLQDMLGWARAYGQGLQRINIWRDAGADLRAGRCYWPHGALQDVGLTPELLSAAVRHNDSQRIAALQPVLTAWQQTTWHQLHAGLAYCLAVRGWRLRLATALPLLLGIHTWQMLVQAGPHALVTHIKWPRRSLYRLLWALLSQGVSDRVILAQWSAAMRGVPPDTFGA